MTETVSDPMAIITVFLEQVIRGLDQGTIDVLVETDSTRDNAEVDYSLTYHDHKIVVWENGTISVDGISLGRASWDMKLRECLMNSCALRADVQARAANFMRAKREAIKKAAEQRARIAELAGKLRP